MNTDHDVDSYKVAKELSYIKNLYKDKDIKDKIDDIESLIITSYEMPKRINKDK